MIRVPVKVLVDDRMDNGCLMVDGENRVGRDVDPVLCATNILELG
jgi:hypothetical protein